MANLKCPKCGGEIESIDSYDSTIDATKVITFNVGQCVECETDFQWREYYTLTHITDPEPC